MRSSVGGLAGGAAEEVRTGRSGRRGSGEQFDDGGRGAVGQDDLGRLGQVLAPELQRTLGSDPRRSYTLQCRGTICRVELMTVPDDETWALELQQEGGLGKYMEAVSLKWARPVYDPRSDKWVTRHEALFTARP